MLPTDPQFIYIILVLPGLFGLALIGDGLNRVVHEEWVGLISIIFGLTFLGIVVFTYLFFSSYLGLKI
ncbi:hypothetical protein A2961_02495 [Candidatus Woesebacteria bacterium RIFCSPLOWO2_01_FULL_39_21]|uniref:Uncharacterized protein n=1 Tax=Candidatus Woesebacteria bacterium RIFCSPLOWO2_01_FULL_39_21 TaxID=1802519 RepID=A0A1F8BGP3_9BACT|nr:MAG: hypothetical protein A2691_04535 [Candidatus Woesebacteria bacterium RIFCSPHIGHO2_01_FULL_39_23]OGM62478.1 MAG: hypothetical protein A2961_02495 [Candidatus Woesebacteria bacterium RIFCSPLOWO2_01_FULL_39_21]